MTAKQTFCRRCAVREWHREARTWGGAVLGELDALREYGRRLARLKVAFSEWRQRRAAG
jgi:hypothetical protein